MKEYEIEASGVADEAPSSDVVMPELSMFEGLITERKYYEFVCEVSRFPAPDIAEGLFSEESEYHNRFFRLLPKELAAQVFVLIPSEVQARIIDSFSDAELSSMLEELYIDDTVDIIEEMPAVVVKRIIRSSTVENRGLINQLLNYPKNSAGTIMTTEYVRLKASMTVGDALEHLRRVAIDKETIYTCYVTDEGRHLDGIVSAKDLLISPTDKSLSEIMQTNAVFVYTTDDREDVAAKFEKYGFLALPVVDREERLVGIITVDDAIDVMKEETEEDFAKMAAITPTTEPYLKSSVFGIFKTRIPWLLLLMISATFSSTILGRFEAALPAVLLLFVPMLMDTGGNSGGQSSVTLIRALSLGEVEYKDVLRVLLKEICVGVFCGVILGAVAFGKVMLIDSLIMGNPDVTLTVALIVSVTLALTVIIAKIVGCTLPLLAGKIGLDPAVMASPFITTVVDAVSLLVYFLVASQLLSL